MDDDDDDWNCRARHNQTRCRSAKQVGLQNQMSNERQRGELQFAERLVNCSNDWASNRDLESFVELFLTLAV